MGNWGMELVKGKEWNGNVGNEQGDAVNLGGNMEDAREQCDSAWNQVGNLGIAVEMTWSMSGNDKLKEWRDITIIENELICKNVVSYI